MTENQTARMVRQFCENIRKYGRTPEMVSCFVTGRRKLLLFMEGIFLHIPN